MASATASQGDTRTEIEDLLQQWKAVMAAARPRWSTADLTFPQLRALSVLQRGHVSVGQLAETLGIGLAAASTLADRMARRQFIVRRSDPDDGRVVRLELSARGRRLIERMERGRTEHLGKVIARMTPAEREAFKTTMRAFVRLTAEHTLTKEPHGLVVVRRRA
ncbi:MAG TPA: MarR family transcriptional regulator [Candidatus Limnocylindria bacterium]